MSAPRGDHFSQAPRLSPGRPRESRELHSNTLLLAGKWALDSDEKPLLRKFVRDIGICHILATLSDW